jgi:hypothetical protein
MLEEWNSYAASVVPVGAGLAQKVETRRAFYAGACAVLSRIQQALSKDDELTDDDMHLMEDIARELTEYGKAVSENRDSAHFRKDNQDD